MTLPKDILGMAEKIEDPAGEAKRIVAEGKKPKPFPVSTVNNNPFGQTIQGWDGSGFGPSFIGATQSMILQQQADMLRQYQELGMPNSIIPPGW